MRSGQPRQFAFDRVQDRRGLLRMRQTEQGHHAVGFDFQHALHQAPGLLLMKTGIAYHEAAETIGLNQEIGPDLAVLQLRLPTSILPSKTRRMPARGASAAELARSSTTCAATMILPCKPASHSCGIWDNGTRSNAPATGILFVRLRKRVGRKFGMRFPFQAKPAEIVKEILGFGCWGRTRRNKCTMQITWMLDGYVVAAVRRLVAHIDRQMGQPLGRIQAQRGRECTSAANGMRSG